MPYQKAMLSLDDARQAMERMLQEALKAPNRPVAIAICDDQGELVTADDHRPKESVFGSADPKRHESLCRSFEGYGPVHG